MSSPEEMLHEVGAFDPPDAKKLLAEFEARGIPFEVEADHRDLTESGRNIQMALGMYPSGSKLVIFVPESRLSRAQALLAELFPV